MSNYRGSKRFNRGRWNKRKRSPSLKIPDDGEVLSNALQVNESQISTVVDQCVASRKFGKRSDTSYYGWQMYFDDEVYKENSSTVKKVQCIEEFLERHQNLTSLANLEATASCNIDVNNLYDDDILMNKWSNIKNDIRDEPKHTLNCLGLAVHQTVINTVRSNDLKNSMDIIANLPMIRVQLFNYDPVIPLRDLKVNSYGKLISTRGCVIRVGRSKHLAQWIAFSCSKCNVQKVVKQPDGIYSVPRKCSICGAGKFKPVLDSPRTKTMLFQMIRVQEHFGDEQNDRGRMPRILDVELIEDLVDTCMPGDDATLTGIIKVRGIDDGTAKKNASTACPLYMEAVSIINNKNKSQNKNTVGVELNLKDYFAIKEVHNKPNIFALLVHSLCPAIYGHEIVKAGLILSLFGGSAKHAELRDDIHVLVVGDPGLGKSQILQACARVAPKGGYICGNSSTASGLTVTLTKENGTNDFALEPGALVLADKGCCCIDEFDKMPTQHQALLEAMEQQSVSVAKSGIVCSLPARTSIIAAANPIKGRYDRSKTVTGNLNMSQPLLSRFDLVFILLDRPNKNLDVLLSEHVMALHTGLNSDKRIKKRSRYNSVKPSSMEERTLREKLICAEDSLNIIPHSILRKYISYACQYVKPKLSTAAASVIQTFYLELRKKNQVMRNVPIYVRQLEALIRLTEARAKLELRVEATETDALEVIEILKETMADVSEDIPILPASDSGKITSKKVKTFIQLLKYEAALLENNVFSMAELNKIAKDGNIIVNDFSNFIQKLNEECYLLKSGAHSYKLISY